MHEQVVRFKLATDQDAETLSSQSAQIIKSEFTILPESTSLSQYNDEYLASHKDCARRTLSALKARSLIKPDLAASCQKDAAALIKLPSITIEEATETLELLRSWNSTDIDSFRSQAAAKWPKAVVFAA